MRLFTGYLKLLIIIATILFLFSCASVVSPKPANNNSDQGKLAKIDEKITKFNQKLEEIYHRISVIQFMVDNHERNFKDYDTKIKMLGNIKKDTNTIANDVKVATINPLEKVPEKKKPVKLEKKPVKIIVKKKPIKKESVTTIYKRAYQEFRNKRYKKAIQLFNRIVKQYPESKLANNALYWTGEIYYDLKKYETAIVFFKRLMKRYPKGNKVPDATLKAGYAFLSLGNKKQAKYYFTRVVSNFPFSRAGSIAEKKLSKLK
ncbi:MAG: tol-pal system protein YbgF [Desulfobacterales bacterium]|nr:tol-pal system protein YbgF [Desulfobacterales bacterium]